MDPATQEITAANATPGTAPTVSEQLAGFTAELALDKVPERIALRAKHLALAAIGCALAARREDFARRIAGSVARPAGPGPRGVVGLALRLPLRDATLDAEIEAKLFDNCALTLDERAVRRVRDTVLDMESVRAVQTVLAISGEAA